MTSGIDSYKILSLKEWCALIGVSISTGKRILANDGPPKIRLSDRRFGIRLSDHHKWAEKLSKRRAV